jgi:Protein of unknown function (DUF3054)
MNPLRFSARLAQVFDVVLVLVFVLIGRVSHGEGLGISGIFVTLWPFLVGLVVGHIVTRGWRHPFRVFWNGIGIWIVTVAIGMLLRVASNQGIEVSFVIVAAAVLGVFLLGWRAIALLVTRKRRVKRSV